MKQHTIANSHSHTIVGSVEAALNFIALTAQKPVTLMYRIENGEPQRTYESIKHRVTILDSRAINERLTLDNQGFALVHHRTAIGDFYDDAEVRAAYYPEVEQLVKQTTGAAQVLVFDHNVRYGIGGRNGTRAPVRFAHNDYTLKSGPQRVRDLMGAKADVLLRSRFAFINVWRPIRGPIEEAPLAICDARSMRPSDFVPTDREYRDRTGEVYSVAFNPEHRWSYFSQMGRDET